MIKLVVKKEDNLFVVDDPSITGSPPVGRGKSITKALGEWLRNNQEYIGVKIEIDESAIPAELKRRKKDLRNR